MLRNKVWILVFAGAGILAISTDWRDDGTSFTATASGDVIAQGRNIYTEHCAACHGAALEGQPDWRSALPSGRLPAPPHDESGHTWHHSDAVLFRIVKEGTAAIVGGGYESDMPGFGDILDDSQIQAVLAYIKSTWPAREREYQEAASRGD